MGSFWERLRSYPEFPTDCKIVVGTNIFHVHRWLLSTNSEYFWTLFARPICDVLESDVVLHDIDAEVFYQILNYCYTGQLWIRDFPSFVAILLASRKFKFTAIQNKCTLEVKNRINIKNWPQMAKLVENLSSSYVSQIVGQFLASNLTRVLEDEDNFRKISDDILEHLLIHGKHINLNKKELLLALLKWTSIDTNRLSVFEKLMNIIDLNSISWNDTHKDQISRILYEGTIEAGLCMGLDGLRKYKPPERVELVERVEQVKKKKHTAVTVLSRRMRSFGKRIFSW